MDSVRLFLSFDIFNVDVESYNCLEIVRGKPIRERRLRRGILRTKMVVGSVADVDTDGDGCCCY